MKCFNDAIQERKDELFRKFTLGVKQVDNVESIKSSFPSDTYLEKLNAHVAMRWGDLKIVMPWNAGDRATLVEYLKELGWELTSDNPRRETQTAWLTYFQYSDVQLELWMKADLIVEGVENVCKVVKLGTKTHSYEEIIYDVVCPGEGR